MPLVRTNRNGYGKPWGIDSLSVRIGGFRQSGEISLTGFMFSRDFRYPIWQSGGKTLICHKLERLGFTMLYAETMNKLADETAEAIRKVALANGRTMRANAMKLAEGKIAEARQAADIADICDTFAEVRDVVAELTGKRSIVRLAVSSDSIVALRKGQSNATVTVDFGASSVSVAYDRIDRKTREKTRASRKPSTGDATTIGTEIRFDGSVPKGPMAQAVIRVWTTDDEGTAYAWDGASFVPSVAPILTVADLLAMERPQERIDGKPLTTTDLAKKADASASDDASPFAGIAGQ